MILNVRKFLELGYREEFQVVYQGSVVEEESFQKISGSKAECVRGPRKGSVVSMTGNAYVVTEAPQYQEPQPRTAVTFQSLPVTAHFWMSDPASEYIKFSETHARSLISGRALRVPPTKLVEPA